VNDLARGYIVLLHYMEKNSPAPLLENPYFFCENGKEFSWKEIADEIAKGLHKAGKIKSLESKSIPRELYGDLLVSMEKHLTKEAKSNLGAGSVHRSCNWSQFEKQSY